MRQLWHRRGKTQIAQSLNKNNPGRFSGDVMVRKSIADREPPRPLVTSHCEWFDEAPASPCGQIDVLLSSWTTCMFVIFSHAEILLLRAFYRQI